MYTDSRLNLSGSIPPRGARTTRLAKSPSPRTTEMIYSRSQGPAEPSLTAPRTNTPIYAPGAGKIERYGQPGGPDRGHGAEGRPHERNSGKLGVPKGPKRPPSPQLVRATTRANSEMHLGRGSGVATPSPSALEDPSGRRLSEALRTFNEECQDLLSVLQQPEVPNNPLAYSAAQPAAAAPISGPAPVSPDRLALRWAAFLAENRQWQLQAIQHRYRGVPLVQQRSIDTANRTAAVALESIAALYRLLISEDQLRGAMAPGGVSASEKTLCTAVSNALASLSIADNDMMATVFDCVVAPSASPGNPFDAPPVACNGIVPPSLDGSQPQPEPTEGVYREELKISAMLLRDLQAENTALREELGEVLKKREKTKRHLKREREEKANIAKHFDVVTGDNAELHRRICQLEGELHQLRAADPEDGAERAAQRALAEEERAKMQTVRGEYARLAAQLERQTDNVRDLREDLLSSERENDALRRTIGMLRDSLVRHRTVIDLLTRDQAPLTPGADRSTGSATPQRANGRPSKQLIEGILAGTISIPSSSEDRLDGYMESSPSQVSNRTFDDTDGWDFKLTRM